MPLQAPEPPRQVVETVQSTFRAMIDTGSVRLPALRNPPGPLALAQPHQIFSLGLADLAAGRGLEAAKSTGWRYLVHAGENPVASAETSVAPTGSEHVFSAFNSGPLVASTVEAIRMVQGLPQVSRGTFEMRLLRVPALYFTALWVHGAQATDDVLVPLEPSPGVVTGKPVPAAPLLQELASKAKSVPAVGPTDRTGG
jgi:hypothetical protein